MKALAYELGTMTYALQRDLLSDYLVQQLRNPSVPMPLAYVLISHLAISHNVGDPSSLRLSG